MLKSEINNLIRRIRKGNGGTTLIEMIVCFALLGIFMACASMIIASITSIYYNIQGETFSNQVSDIIMEKIESEIDGAKYFGVNAEVANPQIKDNSSVSLYDKTYTRVTLGKKDKHLVVKYSPIIYTVDDVTKAKDTLAETEWMFDEAMYKGFMIEELYFYKKGDTIDGDIKNNFGLASDNLTSYGDNVILVLLHLKSDRYGDYYYHRFVKMYNVPAVKAPSGSNP